MKRRLFNVLAAVSLALCVATLGVWMIDHDLGAIDWASDWLHIPQCPWFIEGAGGWATSVGLSFIHVVYRRTDGKLFMSVEAKPAAAALLLAVLPVAKLIAWKRDGSNTRRAACTTCGYDLRATPERCPECGTAAATAVG